MNPVVQSAIQRLLRRRRQASKKQLEDNPSRPFHPIRPRLNLLLGTGVSGVIIAAACTFIQVGVVLGVNPAGSEPNRYLLGGSILALFIFAGFTLYAWRRGVAVKNAIHQAELEAAQELQRKLTGSN